MFVVLMTLHFMVDSARKTSNSMPRTQMQAQSQSPSSSKIIGDDSEEELQAQKTAQLLAQDPNLWTNCVHLKQAGDRCFCTQFVSLCAKNRCPPKVMKIRL